MDGHAKFYKELFAAMDFTTTQLTFLGLRQMWRKGSSAGFTVGFGR
jgi:hypothetical protein